MNYVLIIRGWRVACRSVHVESRVNNFFTVKVYNQGLKFLLWEIEQPSLLGCHLRKREAVFFKALYGVFFFSYRKENKAKPFPLLLPPSHSSLPLMCVVYVPMH